MSDKKSNVDVFTKSGNPLMVYRLCDLYSKTHFENDQQLEEFLTLAKNLEIKIGDVDSKLILVSAMGIRSAQNIGSWRCWLPEIEPQDAIKVCEYVYEREQQNALPKYPSRLENFKFVVDRDKDEILSMLRSVQIKVNSSTDILDGYLYYVRDGVLKTCNSFKLFDGINEVEYSIRQVKEIIRRIKVGRAAVATQQVKDKKMQEKKDEQVEPIATTEVTETRRIQKVVVSGDPAIVKYADRIRDEDLVYIPHLGEGLYKVEKVWSRFVVRDGNNVRLCDAFDAFGCDDSRVKIAFKYTPENQAMLNKLFGRTFLGVNDKPEIQRKVTSLINNGFRILSASNGVDVVSFTKDQSDKLVEFVHENHNYFVVHPITGIVI